jgi:hypothetical protein
VTQNEDSLFFGLERAVADPQVRRRFRIAHLDPRLARAGLVGRGQPLRRSVVELRRLTGELVPTRRRLIGLKKQAGKAASRCGIEQDIAREFV